MNNLLWLILLLMVLVLAVPLYTAYRLWLRRMDEREDRQSLRTANFDEAHALPEHVSALTDKQRQFEERVNPDWSWTPREGR